MQTQVNEYMEKGLAGQLADIGNTDVITRANSQGAAIPFGAFVTKGAAEGQAVLPTTSAQVTGLSGLGVTLRSHTQPQEEGYADNDPMPVIKRVVSGCRWKMPSLQKAKRSFASWRPAQSSWAPSGPMPTAPMRWPCPAPSSYPTPKPAAWPCSI